MSFEAEYLKQISVRFKWAFQRAANAIDQLNDQQVWHRPSPTSNNVGIIVQHLTGNLNQWVCDALGGREYKRNRPQEFEDARRGSKNELLKSFSSLGTIIQEIVSKIPPDSLLSPRHIQGSDETVLSALLLAVTHMELHTGQISYIAKLILNEKYVENRRPTAP
jgi:hypothetical protein